MSLPSESITIFSSVKWLVLDCTDSELPSRSRLSTLRLFPARTGHPETDRALIQNCDIGEIRPRLPAEEEVVVKASRYPPRGVGERFKAESVVQFDWRRHRATLTPISVRAATSCNTNPN